MSANPYNYHLPVQEDAMFYGRTRLLRRLANGLTQPRPLSAAVFGGRRCGKTSLLRKLERDIRAGKLAATNRRLIPWYYDPQAGYPISSSEDFLLLILESLRRELRPEAIAAERLRDAFLSSLSQGPARAFEESFRALAEQEGERIRLVLLVDEAETLLTAPWGDDLRPNMRNILSNSGIVDSMALVMSGATSFHTWVAEKDSPLRNILTRYSLSNLTYEQTLALAREPNGEQLPERAAREIWEQTGGHPCLIQFILCELCLWLNLVKAGPEDVDDAAASFVDLLDHFERWSAALEPLAHDIYQWLIDRDESVRYLDVRHAFASEEGSDLQRELDALLYHGVVNVTGRGRRARYDVAGQMFRDWYLSDRPLSPAEGRGAVQPSRTVRLVAPGDAGAAEQMPPAHREPGALAYDIFDLEIEGRGAGRYEIQVLNAPTGALRSAPVAFDPGEPELSALLERVQVGDVDVALLTEVGRQLHAFLFPPSVRAAYAASREAARNRDRGLCVQLRLHQPELAALPWELLYDPQGCSFFALSDRTPLIRFLPGVLESPLPVVPPPWRLLVVTASPVDLPLLDVEGERDRILSAVRPLLDAGQVTTTVLDHATPTRLLDALREGVHWLHFIGHGEIDPGAGAGALILERYDRTSARVDVQTLRHLLPEVYERPDARLRLAFLNACATAQVGMVPGTRGLAQTLTRAGVPTTIGMGRPIADHSARAFSEGFYRSLAERGWPFPVAVTEGRRRVMLESGLHSGDWAVPVLFMRGMG
jgi:hypothetical protein